MHQPLATYVSAQLRVEMARRGLSNAQLGDLIGVDAMWVWRRARGHTQITLGDLDRIATALGMPVAAFMPHADALTP